MPSLFEKILLILFGRSSLHKTPWGSAETRMVDSQELFDQMLSKARSCAGSEDFNYYIVRFNDAEVEAYTQGESRLTNLKIYTNSDKLKLLFVTPLGALVQVPVAFKTKKFRVLTHPASSLLFEFKDPLSTTRFYFDPLYIRVTSKPLLGWKSFMQHDKWTRSIGEFRRTHYYKLADDYFVDLAERSRENMGVGHILEDGNEAR